MSETKPRHSRRRSAYENLLSVDAKAQAPGSPGVTIEDQPDLGIVTIRGLTSDPEFLNHTEQALGVKLPIDPSSSVCQGEVRALWIGPDEWWVLCPATSTTALLSKLETALKGLFVQVIDNSSGLSALRLSGGEHLTILRHLCPYPVESINVGQCVSTVFPKANVTLLRLDSANTLLISRRSYAHWISELLMRSAKPYGLALVHPDD